MNFSGYDAEPDSRFSGAASLRTVTSIRCRSDVISHDCSSRAHAVSKHRATPPLTILETPSGPLSSALTTPPVRHANCSDSDYHSHSAFELDAFEIQSEGFGAIAHCASLPFSEAIRLQEFSRIEVESGLPRSVFLERIVRQPTRRDSKCVPQ